MKPGGIMWTSPAVVVPLVDEDGDEDPTAPDPILWAAVSIDRELAGPILPLV